MPARRYRVSPRQRPGRPGFVATFRDHAGARRNRGLATESRAEAELICAALVRLHDAGAPAADAPRDLPAKALELYYGEALPPSIPQAPLVEPDEEPLDLPPLEAAYVSGLQHELAAAHADRDRLRAELQQARADLAALRASVLGRAAEAAERCPPMAEAVEAFHAHLEASVAATTARDYRSALRRFLASIADPPATPADIRPADVAAYLDDYCRGAPKPATRRWKARLRLSRFLTWAARTYGVANPLDTLPTPKPGAVGRERDSIHWHTLEEVQAVLERLPDDYWRAVVASLAFAGLQLAELVWLRPEDVQQRPGGGMQLWVGPTSEHQLKTHHRRRAIAVHPRHLEPLLHAALDGATDAVLFPMPKDMQRRARRAGGDRDRWQVQTLGKRLLGQPEIPATETRKARPAVAGLLPAGMTARSLRRTFGSLLLRSGKTEEEVAAAMGNTPAVVRSHYARIIGAEVDVDF